jgi:hypothetical protein
VGSDVGTSTPTKNSQEAVLFHANSGFLTPQLFSDSG